MVAGNTKICFPLVVLITKKIIIIYTSLIDNGKTYRKIQ